MSNDVRIKLVADTNEFEKSVREADKMLGNIGKNPSSSNASGNPGNQQQQTASTNSVGTTQQDVSDALKNAREKLKIIENEANKAKEEYHNSTAKDAQKIYQDKLNELEAKKRLIESQINSGNSGTTSNPGSGGTTSSSSSTPSSSTPNSNSGGTSSSGGNIGSILRGLFTGGNSNSLLDGLLKGGATMVALNSTKNYLAQGMSNAQNQELQAYKTYNRTGVFGSNFNDARRYASNVGVENGYTASETMSAQDILLSGGFTSKEDLTRDTEAVQQLAKARGMNVNNVASLGSSMVKQGILSNGDMNKLSNTIGTVIKDTGMTGRESEVIESIGDLANAISSNSLLATNEGLNNAVGLYSELANSNESLKGERGVSMVTQMDNAMETGNNEMDLLLGWGTKYTGASGRWQLELAKERGITDSENLKQIYENFPKFSGGMSINSAQGKLALKNLFGLSASQVDAITTPEFVEKVKNDEIGEDYLNSLANDEGQKETNELNENYNNSKVSTQEKYNAEKDSSQAEAGNGLNTITKPFKELFNAMPTWLQVPTSIGGNILKGYGMYKGASLLKDLFFGGSSGSTILNALKSFFTGGASSATAGATAGATGATTAGATGATTAGAEATASMATGATGATTAGATGALATGATLASSVLGGGLLIASAPILDAGTKSKRAEEEQQVLSRFAEKYSNSGESLEDYWKDDEVELSPYVQSAGYTQDDLEAMTNTRNEFLSQATSEEGATSIKDTLNKEIEDKGSISEKTLKKLFTYTDSQGREYTASQDDINSILQKTYGTTNGVSWSKLGFLGDYNNDAITKFVKKYKSSDDKSDTKELADAYDTYDKAVDKEKENIAERNKQNKSTVYSYNSYSSSTAESTDEATSGGSESTANTNLSSSKSWFKKLFGWLPGFATGLDTVPEDDYPVRLHKDEAVLNKEDARIWRSEKGRYGSQQYLGAQVVTDTTAGISSKASIGGTLEVKITGDGAGITKENQAQIAQAIIASISSSNLVQEDRVLSSLGNAHVRIPN